MARPVSHMSKPGFCRLDMTSIQCHSVRVHRRSLCAALVTSSQRMILLLHASAASMIWCLWSRQIPTPQPNPRGRRASHSSSCAPARSGAEAVPPEGQPPSELEAPSFRPTLLNLLSLFSVSTSSCVYLRLELHPGLIYSEISGPRFKLTSPRDPKRQGSLVSTESRRRFMIKGSNSELL